MARATPGAELGGVLEALLVEVESQIGLLEQRRTSLKRMLSEDAPPEADEEPYMLELARQHLGERLGEVDPGVLAQEKRFWATLDAFRWPQEYQEFQEALVLYLANHPEQYEELLVLEQRFAALAHQPEDSREVEQLAEEYVAYFEANPLPEELSKGTRGIRPHGGRALGGRPGRHVSGPEKMHANAPGAPLEGRSGTMKRALKVLVPLVILAEATLVWSGVMDLGDAVLLVAGLEALLFVAGLGGLVLVVGRYRKERRAGTDAWRTLEDSLSLVLPRVVARSAVKEPRLLVCLSRWAFRRVRLTNHEFAYHKRSLLRAIVPLLVVSGPVELLVVHVLALAFSPGGG